MTTTNSSEMKPKVGKSLSYGWDTMKRYFLPLLLVAVVLGFIQGPMRFLNDNNHGDVHEIKVVAGFLVMILWLFIFPVIEYGADIIFVRAVRNEKIDFNDLISGFSNYLNIILTHIFTVALVGMSLVALIIPGIIVACRLAFVSYLVMDKGLDPIAAVETSWKMTRGHGWRIFWLGFTCIFIFIAGLACLIVGVFPAIIWCKASFASLYQAVLDERTDMFPVASIEQGA